VEYEQCLDSISVSCSFSCSFEKLELLL